jgi:hypothetical protein
MSERGFSEVVMVTAVPDQLRAFYEALGWQAEDHEFSPDALRYWDLADVTGSECVLQAPDADCRVRLLPVPDTVPLSRPLSTELIVPCGLFDINMRTIDSERSTHFIQKHGWRPLTPPIPWQFGDNAVKEFLAVQADGIVLVIVERVSPPLPGPPMDHMSHVFNSTQLVLDHDESLACLEALGFIKFAEFTGPLPGEGPKVLDLLDRPGDEGDIRLTISQPAGVLDGAIELISTPNIPVTPILENGQGKRGLAALRIPCDDIESRYNKLASGDWSHIINKPLANRSIDGADQLCYAVVTPGGARLDFFAA